MKGAFGNTLFALVVLGASAQYIPVRPRPTGPISTGGTFVLPGFNQEQLANLGRPRPQLSERPQVVYVPARPNSLPQFPPGLNINAILGLPAPPTTSPQETGAKSSNLYQNLPFELQKEQDQGTEDQKYTGSSSQGNSPNQRLITAVTGGGPVTNSTQLSFSNLFQLFG